MSDQNSPEQVTRLGEEIYLTKLRDILEPEHTGEYLVLNVTTQEYFLDKDMLAAVEKARAKFPGELFYIATVGNITRAAHHKGIRYAWHI